MNDDARPSNEPTASIVGAKVDAGALPLAGKGRTLVARGSEQACSACDKPIGRTEMELATNLDSGNVLRFDLDCFTAWWNVTRSRRGVVAI